MVLAQRRMGFTLIVADRGGISTRNARLRRYIIVFVAGCKPVPLLRLTLRGGTK